MSKDNKIISIFWTIAVFILIKGEFNGWFDQLMVIKYPMQTQIISTLIWYLGVMFLLYKYDIHEMLQKYFDFIGRL